MVSIEKKNDINGYFCDEKRKIKKQPQLKSALLRNYSDNRNFSPIFGSSNLLVKFLQMCDSAPVFGITFIDTVSTTIPRSVVDLKTAGIPAALETARREFSGTLVDCLIPGFVAMGVAACGLDYFFMKNYKDSSGKKVSMKNVWANEDSIKHFSEIYKNVKDQEKPINAFVENSLKNLEALDGENWIKFKDRITNKDFNNIVAKVSQIIDSDKVNKKEIKKVYQEVAQATHATEIIRQEGQKQLINGNFSTYLRDMIDLGQRFKHESVTKDIDQFSKKAISLVNGKSAIALGIILPIAVSMQSINRWLTRKQYNVEGAPIYKDFEKGNTHREMSEKEKVKFMIDKILLSAAMVGIGFISLGSRKLNMKMLQFNGLFPSVDQCRIISVITFVSRLFASEDENELREAFVRDAVSFAGLYMLGDYVAKGIASAIEAGNKNKAPEKQISLLNRLEVAKQGDSIWKKAKIWFSKTSIKSFDEIKGSKALRGWCQVANIGFSLLTLGVLLPAYNRYITEKKVKQEKEIEQQLKGIENKNNSNSNEKIKSEMNVSA